MNGISFSGNLFFDPLATGTGTAPAQAGSGRGDAEALASPGRRRRGTQTAAEQKALRATSLMKVGKDLERMLRERAR